MGQKIYVWDLGFPGFAMMAQLCPLSVSMTTGQLYRKIGLDSDTLKPYLQKLKEVGFVNVDGDQVSATSTGRAYFAEEIQPFRSR